MFHFLRLCHVRLCRNFLEITNKKYNDVTHHVTHVIQSGAEPDYESGNAGYTALQLAVQHNNVASVTKKNTRDSLM